MRLFVEANPCPNRACVDPCPNRRFESKRSLVLAALRRVAVSLRWNSLVNPHTTNIVVPTPRRPRGPAAIRFASWPGLATRARQQRCRR
jgi:hypothetical protein